MLKAIDINY